MLCIQWLTAYQQFDDEIRPYGDVIMDAMESQITSLTIVYSTVYSDTDQRKLESSGDRWIPRTNGR